MRILVTRPEPECDRTAALLRQRGHEVLRLPLLRLEPIADAELGAGPWAAVLFTSTNAVRAVAAHRRFRELANLPVYAVGRRTKAAATAAGFVSVMSADGDVNTLVRLVASTRPVANSSLAGANLSSDAATNSSPPPCGPFDKGSGGSGVGVEPEGTSRPAPPPQSSPSRNRVYEGFGRSIKRPKSATADFGRGEGVAGARREPKLASENLPLLYCAGEDRAGDLAGALQSRGLLVETALVYRAIMVTELTPDVRTALFSGAIDAVLHYSARTAAAFVAAAARAGMRDLSTQTRHLCLSAQVAAPLAAAGAKSVEVAGEPNEQALLVLTRRT